MREELFPAAYMLASAKHGTLYLGSAANLIGRVSDHKHGQGSLFTAKYKVNRLVWYEPFMLITDARCREYEMKKWRRDWKINLIERDNPNWDDLFPSLTGERPIRPLHPDLVRALKDA